MRDRYVRDISDLLKVGLLHTLGADRHLGIAWYYNPAHDGRNDGRHTESLSEDKWLAFDPSVLTLLQRLSERSVVALQNEMECSGLWQAGLQFHGLPVPDRPSRIKWTTGIKHDFENCKLVFVNPDNGVGSSSRRHATFEEIRFLRRPGGKALLLIKFPGRVEFNRQEDLYHAALRLNTGADRMLTLRTSVAVRTDNGRVVPRFRWFTLLDYDDVLAERLEDFARKLDAIPGATARVRSVV
jgi:hypothetical protein